MLANKKAGDIEAGTSPAAPTRELYPGMTESPELRLGLIPKIYVILSVLFLLAALVVVVVIIKVGASLSFFVSCIINTIGFALCVEQFYTDWTCVNGDLLFNNFSLLDKLVSCCKLYIIGYDAVHTDGSEMFGFLCLLGCFLHWFSILYHLVRNYRTWIRTRVLGMISLMAGGVSLLCRGMVIHNVWNTDVVPAIIIFIVLIDGGLLVRAQIKKTGGNEQSLRDLLIKLLETTISIIRLVDLKGQTHKPWDAEEILHLVGSSLSVLIGICLIGFMVYNVHILVMSKLIEWRGKIARVFAVGEDDNVEEQAADDGVVDRDGTRNEI